MQYSTMVKNRMLSISVIIAILIGWVHINLLFRGFYYFVTYSNF